MPRLSDHAPGTAAHDLVQQRVRIARVLLGSVVALGLVAYLPSVWLSVEVGAWAIAVLETVAYAAIVAAFVHLRAAHDAEAGVLRGSAERAEELAAELVAERLRLEDANERLQAEMSEHAAAEARLRQAEKLTALGTLAGGIAHNLNNLLTPILMGVDLMRSEKEVDEELLDRMQEAAVGAREVVRQVLTFSRAVPDERVTIDAAEAFGEPAALLRASLPPRVELQTRFASDLGAVSLAPADAHQIVLNLGSNAEQAMPEGGKLTLTVDVVHGVAPGLDPRREYLCLGIRDTGTGMDAETITRATEPFFTTQPAGNGTGLGLPTVHGIVTAAGGALRIFSEPGLGTAVHVYLPRLAEPVPDTPAPTRPALATSGARVLLVDDDSAVLAVATAFLRRLGHEVAACANVGAARAWLSAHRGEADLLLTDLNMPAGGGVALVREARALQPKLPIVLMSGFLDEPHYARARAVGVRHILAKPFQMDEIGAAVEEALRSPTADPEPAGGR